MGWGRLGLDGLAMEPLRINPSADSCLAVVSGQIESVSPKKSKLFVMVVQKNKVLLKSRNSGRKE